ncbi:MAG: DNRLRE domain-containing protein [Chitinivibrionales bacterium]|nr:DNRLRE domain-containing protein [Chitinivibrionales bacterium]
MTAKAKISKALLSVYAYKMDVVENVKNYPIKNDEKSVYALTKEWDEKTVSFKTLPALSSSAAAVCANKTVKAWDDYDVTAAIRTIVENSGSNFGFCIKFTKQDAETEKGIVLYSSEASDATLRPKLTVTYQKAETGVATNGFNGAKNNLRLSKASHGILVSSSSAALRQVIVYDLHGKTIAQVTNNAASSALLCTLDKSALVYVLKISTDRGDITRTFIR